MKMLNLYHPMSILMLLEDFFGTFNETQGLSIGFQNYSIWETSFQTCIFLYKKKYWTNIEFEKIMSDPSKQILPRFKQVKLVYVITPPSFSLWPSTLYVTV